MRSTRSPSPTRRPVWSPSRRREWTAAVSLRLLINAALLVSACGLSNNTMAHAESTFDLTTQQYLCYDTILSLDEMADCGITVLSHPTWRLDPATNRRRLEKAHAVGIKVLPYVSPEKAWQLDTDERLREFNSVSSATTIPYYRAVDPSSNWDWVLVNPDGQYQPRYGSLIRGEDGTWSVDWKRYLLGGVWTQRPRPIRYTWYMCSSVQGYSDAVIRGVRAVMDLGYDGLFVDNIATRRLARCHGPEHGKHKHIDGKAS